MSVLAQRGLEAFSNLTCLLVNRVPAGADILADEQLVNDTIAVTALQIRCNNDKL